MTEYIVKPNKKGLPSGHFLLEELHRRGLPAALDLKGTDAKWDAILFSEPGPPEMGCFLQFEASQGVFKITLPKDSPAEAQELQVALADILLRELGGKVHDTSTNDHHDLETFIQKTKKFSHPAKQGLGKVAGGRTSQTQGRESFWMVLSWGSVLLGLWIYFSIPRYHQTLTLAVVGLAALSAIGLTLFKPTSK
jgi:hypothetical protein